jgi:hypothetical protein
MSFELLRDLMSIEAHKYLARFSLEVEGSLGVVSWQVLVGGSGSVGPSIMPSG